MLKVLIGAALLAFTVGEAQAISRYQTMRMSCAEVQSVLQRDGAAILRWQSRNNPTLPLYGRYVSDGRFCQLGEVTDFDSVPTADTPSCMVKQCVRPDIDRRWLLYDR